MDIAWFFIFVVVSKHITNGKKVCHYMAFSSFVVLCRGRVGLMPDISLFIEVPKETDFGFYTCHAANDLGSTSLSFQLQKAGK